MREGKVSMVQSSRHGKARNWFPASDGWQGCSVMIDKTIAELIVRSMTVYAQWDITSQIMHIH